MKKKLPLGYLAMFALTIGLLILTTVEGASSSLTYESDKYESEYQMEHIGITLLENGSDVGHRDYYTVGEKGESTESGWKVDSKPLFESITDFQIGRTYDEVFNVKNSGGIPEYVRVIVYKYWIDSDGNKVQALNPDYIECGFVSNGTNNWLIDSEESTTERTIFYYTDILEVGQETKPFMNTLKISDDVKKGYKTITEKVENEDKTKTNYKITYSYQYDGYTFCVEMEADAVQTHNAADAVRSAWGNKVTINAGKLSLS